jgi:hypothetical protein
MKNISIQNKPLDICQEILEHNPDTSMEDIAEVVSEWGDLISDRQHSMRESTKVPHQQPNSQEKSIFKF